MNRNLTVPALQKHVLESLLKGGRNSQNETKGTDNEAVAASMVKPLQTAIGNWLPNVKVERAQACVRIERAWWKSVEDGSLIAAFSSSSDASPSCFLAMPARLVSSALTVQLGIGEGLPENVQTTRLGTISLRFAERLSMDVWPAVQQLTGSLPGTVTVLEKANFEISERENPTNCVLFLYIVKIFNREISFGISVPENNLILCSSIEISKGNQNNSLREANLQFIESIKSKAEVTINIKNCDIGYIRKLKIGDIVEISNDHFLSASLKIRGRHIYKGEVGEIGQIYSFKVVGPEKIDVGSGNVSLNPNLRERNLPNHKFALENAATTVSDLSSSEDELNRAIADLRGLSAIDRELKSPPADSIATVGSVAMQIPVVVSIVLGSVEMLVGEMAELKSGSTISLDRKVGEPLDVLVNGVAIARGQIVLVGDDQDRFGLRIAEILRPN